MEGFFCVCLLLDTAELVTTVTVLLLCEVMQHVALGNVAQPDVTTGKGETEEIGILGVDNTLSGVTAWDLGGPCK